MKQIYLDGIALVCFAGLGFLFPWWTIYILSFIWAIAKLAGAPRIFLYAFLSQTVLIYFLGNDLLPHLSFGLPHALTYAWPLVVGLVLALPTYFIGSAVKR